MRKFSNDKDINKEVNNLLKNGWKSIIGKKHCFVLSPNNVKISIPSTPSCPYSVNNFRRDIKKAEKGLNY